MKRNLSVIFFVLAIISLLIVAGCAPSKPVGPGPTSVVPTSCSLTVVSQCLACYGYVWVNGASTGQYITNNGSVTLTVPCGQVRVEIRDELGYVSHTEYINTPQQNMVVFTYWN